MAREVHDVVGLVGGEKQLRYGTARRGAAARMRLKSAKVYCHGDVENVSARVHGECVVRLSWV